MVIKARAYVMITAIAFTVFLSACSTTQKITSSPRTPIEQLLHSEAITRSLTKQNEIQSHIPPGAKIALSTTGLSPDNPFAGGMIGSWLSRQGYIIDNSENAQYKIHVTVNALGTELGETFFGIPPVSGSFIPISLPELAIYKSQNQVGYTNFKMDIYELPSNRFMHTTVPYTAEAYFNDYTFFFVFKFSRTDLINPPQFRSLSRIIQ